MPRTFKLIAVLTAIGVAGGCSDTMQGPEAEDVGVSANAGGTAACPLTPTTVVNDEASLVAAVAAAVPGDVIALDGQIELTTSQGGGGVVVATDDVTLTCATAGSGLFGTAGGDFNLLRVFGNRVSVNRLDLDGRQVTTAYIGFGDDLSFTRNSVRCGAVCSWFQGALAPYVALNSYDATDPGVNSFSAIQIQGGTTDAVVERNDVVGSGFTGIRLRSGVNHTLDHNSVSGAWTASMVVSPTSEVLTGAEVKSNRLEGATVFGLLIGGQPNTDFVATGNVVQNNIVTGAGQAGVSVRLACSNHFQGNNLSGNADNVGLFFDVSTGANRYEGNKNLVVDDGDFDCDGDGTPDPNEIVGT